MFHREPPRRFSPPRELIRPEAFGMEAFIVLIIAANINPLFLVTIYLSIRAGVPAADEERGVMTA